MKAVRDQESLKEIDSYVEHFRRVVLTDPDLLPGHANQVLEQTKQQVDGVTTGTKTSGGAKVRTLPPLSELKLTPL